MKRLYFILWPVFLAHYLCLNAQDTSNDSSSYVTFSPATLVDPYAQRYRFGYIQHLNQNLKIGVDLGYGNNSIVFNFSEEIRSAYDLWEIRPEIYAILNAQAKTLKYISLELFYINQFNTFQDGSYETEINLVNASRNRTFDYDQADFERKKYGLHLKYGLLLNIGKYFGLNFSGGIGFRQVNQAYDNFINRVARRSLLFEGIGNPYFLEEKNFNWHPTLAIKLFYRL